MPLTRTEMFVHDFVKITEETIDVGEGHASVALNFSQPNGCEVMLRMDMSVAERVREAILVGMRRHYVAAAGQMIADWADGKHWIRKVVVSGFQEEVNITVYIDPMNEDWTTSMRIERIREITSAGMMVGGCLNYLVHSHYFEGDAEEPETRPESFRTTVYERKNETNSPSA